MSAVTWREMAAVLAERLQQHAALCGQSRGAELGAPRYDGCAHDPAESYKTAGECPFCADHSAHSQWLRKEAAAKARASQRARRVREIWG